MTRAPTILMGLLVAAGAFAQESDEERLIQQKCGAYAAEIQQAKTSVRAQLPEPPKVSRPALRRELLSMEDLDQKVRAPNLLDADGQMDPVAAKQMADVDAEDLLRLRHIFRQDGFPTVAMVGRDGVFAAWILVQHADADPDFQSSILALLAARVQRGEVKSQDLALLTDRVLRARNKPQRYGSQFEFRGSELVAQPIEDAAHVDKRRRAVGLPSMKAYACMLRAVYNRSNDDKP